MLVSSNIGSIFPSSYTFTTAKFPKQEEVLILILLKSLLKVKELKFYINPNNTPGKEFYFKYFPNVFTSDSFDSAQFSLCFVSCAVIEKLMIKANEQIPNLFWGRKYTVINQLTGDILGETEDSLESQQKPLYPIVHKLKYIFCCGRKLSTSQ